MAGPGRRLALSTLLVISPPAKTIGSASAIVPVVVGESGLARRMTHHMIGNGAVINLVESPAVARNHSRWRVQIMAGHTEEHIDRFIEQACSTRATFASSGLDLKLVPEPT
jgi:7-keto-8-aminopelargonate synthetase-like enzyme